MHNAPLQVLSFALVVLLGGLSPALGAQTRLLADLNQTVNPNPSSRPMPADAGTRWSNTRRFAQAGIWTYFVAETPTTGPELARSNGTATGMGIIADLEPGVAGASVTDVTVLGNRVFFVAVTTLHGRRLFVTDVATNQIRVLPGDNAWRPIVFRGQVYFVVVTSSLHHELWKTDGTSAGTARVLAGGILDLDPVRVFRNQLLFGVGVSAASILKNGLYLSDGTVAGTKWLGMYSNETIGGGAELNGKLYFGGSDSSTYGELFVTDGTQVGTGLFKDLEPGAGSSKPASFIAMHNRVYFSAETSAAGRELHWTDGVSVQMIDMVPGTFPGDPRDFVQFGSDLFFAAAGVDQATNRNIGTELWKFDGTTLTGYDLVPGVNSAHPRDLVELGGALYFSGWSPYPQNSLFRWTRTGGATVLHNSSKATGEYPRYLTPTLAGRLVFTGRDQHGWELWSSDGSVAGTAMIADLATDASTQDSSPRHLYSYAGRVFFSAADALGLEPFVSDGTKAGTRSLGDLYPGDLSSMPEQFFGFGHRVLFQASGFDSATNRPAGAELWVIDINTLALTLIDIAPGVASSRPSGFVEHQGRVYFTADGSINGSGFRGRELWSTDGTRAGTRLAADIHPTGSSQPDQITSLGGFLYCRAFEPSTGLELYRSDGTTAGTARVADVLTGTGGSDPRNLTAVGDRLFFVAAGDINGGKAADVDLWVSDGTRAGTLPLGLGTTRFTAPRASRILGPADETIPFVTLDDRVFFVADAQASGFEVYVSDGTKAGTYALDLWPGSRSGAPQYTPAYLTRSGDRVLFRGASPTLGYELHYADGTRTGYGIVRDISFLGSSNPKKLVALGTRVAFVADDGVHGSELWVTDGTRAGTMLYEDILPGKDVNGAGRSSDASYLIAHRGQVWLAARTPKFGRELLIADLGATATAVDRGCGAGIAPRLHGTPPVLGRSVTLEIHGVTAGKAGFLALGVATPVPLDFGAGCRTRLNLARPLLLQPLAATPSGVVRVALPLPGNPALKGLLVPAQAVVGPTATPPFGLDWSNGIELYLSDR